MYKIYIFLKEVERGVFLWTLAVSLAVALHGSTQKIARSKP